MSQEDFKLELKKLLDNYGKVIHEDGAFCTSYYLVAEWFDGDGEYWSNTVYEDKVPVWHVTGLVQHSLENDFNQEVAEEGEE
jgi:hypothetical protein